MRLAVHVGRILRAALLFGRGSGRLSVLVVVVVGLLLMALTVTAKTVVPIAAYPFA